VFTIFSGGYATNSGDARFYGGVTLHLAGVHYIWLGYTTFSGDVLLAGEAVCGGGIPCLVGLRYL
jgi:hypothetical protein